MPCKLILSTIPGHLTHFGMTLELMGTCLARKEIEIVSTVADAKAAIADFGREVHQAHPDKSFYISVRIAKGFRAPNGFNAANQKNELGEKAYLKMEEPTPCPATA
jgi:hypothetical protein